MFYTVALTAFTGSPNMTMDLAQAEAQNTQGWLANTDCSNVTDVLTCIQDLNSSQVLAALPQAWDPPTYFPLVRDRSVPLNDIWVVVLGA